MPAFPHNRWWTCFIISWYEWTVSVMHVCMKIWPVERYRQAMMISVQWLVWSRGRAGEWEPSQSRLFPNQLVGPRLVHRADTNFVKSIRVPPYETWFGTPSETMFFTNLRLVIDPGCSKSAPFTSGSVSSESPPLVIIFTKNVWFIMFFQPFFMIFLTLESSVRLHSTSSRIFCPATFYFK
mgnify:CR=1 FL=1